MKKPICKQCGKKLNFHGIVLGSTLRNRKTGEVKVIDTIEKLIEYENSAKQFYCEKSGFWFLREKIMT